MVLHGAISRGQTLTLWVDNGCSDQGGAEAERAEAEVRVMGSRGQLLRTLVAASATVAAIGAAPRIVPKWRTGWDSNPRWARTHGGFQDRCLDLMGAQKSDATR